MKTTLLLLGTLVLAVSWLTARLALPRVRRAAVASGRVDRPGGRKTQPSPVPYGGGLVVLLGFAAPVLGGVALVALGMDPPYAEGITEKTPQVVAILAGALGLLLVGRLDDRSPLPAAPRFALQLAAAGAVVATGLRVTLFLESDVLQIVISVAWIVFVTNCFNFIDNMDGLLVGTGLGTAVTLFALAAFDGQWFVAGFALALAGPLAAILPANVRPARIYLGDEGSMFLGFLFACLTIAASYQSERQESLPTYYPFAIPFLVLLVPVTDGLVAVTGRLRRGVAPWTAGRDHLSHRLAARGWGPSGSVLLLVGVTYAGGAAALMAYGTAAGRGWAALGFATVMLVCWRRALRAREAADEKTT